MSQSEDKSFSYALNQRDDAEWERLRLQSRPIWECVGNRFVFSTEPKDIRSVLDLGCGSCEWLVSTSEAELEGATEFCGLDQSSALFPDTASLSKNGKTFDLRVGDLTDIKSIPREWEHKFDLVNMRLVLLWIPRRQWSNLAQVLQFVTKPGGYFQSVDFASALTRLDRPHLWGLKLVQHTFRQWQRCKSDVQHHPEEIMDFIREHLTLSTGNWMTCKFEERSLLMGAAHPLKGDKNVMIAVNVIRRAQSAKWFGNGYHQRGGVLKSFAMHHYVMDLMEETPAYPASSSFISLHRCMFMFIISISNVRGNGVIVDWIEFSTDNIQQSSRHEDSSLASANHTLSNSLTEYPNHPNQISQRQSLTGSLDSVIPEKGLINSKGEQNCFINSVIQALWHLESFRKAFGSCADHNHPGLTKPDSTCIFCALQVIFANYQYGQDDIIPPTALREAMSSLFKSQERFQLGQYADATEALEEIIFWLHAAVTFPNGTPEDEIDAICVPPCFVHKVFRLNVLEQQVCHRCGAQNEPMTSSNFVHYVYAAVLRRLSKRNIADFSRILKAADDEDKRPCSNECDIEQHLLNQPEVISVCIVWDSTQPPKEDISKVLDCIGMSIRPKDIFSSADGKDKDKTYILRGMICYYGCHYDSYFYNSQQKAWFVFDDANVKQVGTSWAKVKERCLLGKFQPSLLFYENSKNAPPPEISENEVISRTSHYNSSHRVPEEDKASDRLYYQPVRRPVYELDKNPIIEDYKTTGTSPHKLTTLGMMNLPPTVSHTNGTLNDNLYRTSLYHGYLNPHHIPSPSSSSEMYRMDSSATERDRHEEDVTRRLNSNGNHFISNNIAPHHHTNPQTDRTINHTLHRQPMMMPPSATSHHTNNILTPARAHATRSDATEPSRERITFDPMRETRFTVNGETFVTTSSAVHLSINDRLRDIAHLIDNAEPVSNPDRLLSAIGVDIGREERFYLWHVFLNPAYQGNTTSRPTSMPHLVRNMQRVLFIVCFFLLSSHLAESKTKTVQIQASSYGFTFQATPLTGSGLWSVYAARYTCSVSCGPFICIPMQSPLVVCQGSLTSDGSVTSVNVTITEDGALVLPASGTAQPGGVYLVSAPRNTVLRPAEPFLVSSNQIGNTTFFSIDMRRQTQPKNFTFVVPVYTTINSTVKLTLPAGLCISNDTYPVFSLSGDLKDTTRFDSTGPNCYYVSAGQKGNVTVSIQSTPVLSVNTTTEFNATLLRYFEFQISRNATQMVRLSISPASQSCQPATIALSAQSVFVLCDMAANLTVTSVVEETVDASQLSYQPKYNGSVVKITSATPMAIVSVDSDTEAYYINSEGDLLPCFRGYMYNAIIVGSDRPLYIISSNYNAVKWNLLPYKGDLTVFPTNDTYTFGHIQVPPFSRIIKDRYQNTASDRYPRYTLDQSFTDLVVVDRGFVFNTSIEVKANVNYTFNQYWTAHYKWNARVIVDNTGRNYYYAADPYQGPEDYIVLSDQIPPNTVFYIRELSDAQDQVDGVIRTTSSTDSSTTTVSGSITHTAPNQTTSAGGVEKVQALSLLALFVLAFLF
ncbi:hypothetical protein PROFUN_05588 [Planoprotostelium fungivorum]|uniref:USP domain-containing protein n=1 Tax=Planoprotostelium fungivorum TaxID=1890364 RepID=A0A2P6N077_9EUKA|nr:hypothetical protein PROFUN_05588 [Planoprotostelium fungivorum]